MIARAAACAHMAALVCLLASCVSRSAIDRALERMNEQPRYDVYESSRFFRDSMTMRVPPAGTVPRDAVLDRRLATGRTSSGTYVTGVPESVTPKLLQLGRTRFQIFCAACHGTGGYGGSVVASNLTEQRPPSLRSRAVSALPAGFFYEVISQGVGRMPSYAAELPVDQRWAVVAYLQQLQSRPNASPGERQDSIRGAELRTLDSVRQVTGDSVR
jgi:mono/diheme cytochrome c family protein